MGAIGHAKRFSPSTSKRWMNCVGSVALIERLGLVSQSSTYAEQGTAAHALGERCLLEGCDAEEYLGHAVGVADGKEEQWFDADLVGSLLQAAKERKDDGDPFSELLASNGLDSVWLVDTDMAGAVQLYLDVIRDEAERLGAGTRMLVERRVHYLRGIGDPEDGFGTGDCALVSDFCALLSIDYKHGAGVAVDAEENTQLLAYLLGFVEEEGWDFGEFTGVIVQPRARHADGPVRRWTVTRERLLRFKADAEAAAARILAGDTELRAGDWCTFCEARGVCPALYEAALREAEVDFSASGTPEVDLCVEECDDEELGRRLRVVPLLDAFVKAVKGEGMRRLLAGRAVSGHKLVRGKTNRAWVAGHVDALVERGFRPEDLFITPEPEVKSPAQVERLRPEGLKAKDVKAAVAELTFKPEGKLTMAGEDDPREAVTLDDAIAADFEDVPEADADV